MEHTSEVRHQLFDHFVRTVLEKGWRDLSCADIAAEAGVDIKTAFGEYRNRYSYVSELVRRIDIAMLDAYDSDMQDEPARERLFDVMMARFEAMQAHRDVIVALTKAARCDPKLSLHLMALSRLTADWFLDVARISPAGVSGMVRSKGALAAYARAFGVWLKDDSEDLAKTMASLDKTLKRGEKALRRAEKFACGVMKLSKRSRKSADKDAAEDQPQPAGPSVTEAPSVDDGSTSPMPS